jgi:transcriptional regulator with XRE-family HTH domain
MTESINSIGQVLREGRLRKRLSLAECSKRTHIAVPFLEALEDERWEALPSESHRLGFLRYYARFLDVWSDELLDRYRRYAMERAAQKVKEESFALKPHGARPAIVWSFGSWPQACLLGICLLILTWSLYHGIGHHGLEDGHTTWIKFRKKTSHLPLTTQKPYVQRLTLKAAKDSWLRVSMNRHLLFEGVLPAATVKEWTGPGPFHIRIANVSAVSLYWNGQPVDLQSMGHGATAELHLPPH